MIEPLTQEGAQAITQGIARSDPRNVSYYFPEGNFEARSSYVQTWQHFGGTGDPPAQGFVVRGASGETEFMALTFRPPRMENARLAPMTEQQRGVISQSFPDRSNVFHGQGGYELYAAEWRVAGGEGPPPEFGFIIKQPDGSVVRSIGYSRRGMEL